MGAARGDGDRALRPLAGDAPARGSPGAGRPRRRRSAPASRCRSRAARSSPRSSGWRAAARSPRARGQLRAVRSSRRLPRSPPCWPRCCRRCTRWAAARGAGVAGRGAARRAAARRGGGGRRRGRLAAARRGRAPDARRRCAGGRAGSRRGSSSRSALRRPPRPRSRAGRSAPGAGATPARLGMRRLQPLLVLAGRSRRLRRRPAARARLRLFGVAWLRERTFPEVVRDAHSLELETPASWDGRAAAARPFLGGVAVAAVRAPARRRPARSPRSRSGRPRALDWDWEMPAGTLRRSCSPRTSPRARALASPRALRRAESERPCPCRGRARPRG